MNTMVNLTLWFMEEQQTNRGILVAIAGLWFLVGWFACLCFKLAFPG